MLLSRRKNSLYLVSSNAKEIIIPEGVTSIHAYAFKYCNKLRKIEFPSSYDWSGWHNPSVGPILYINDGMRDAEIIINGDKARYENDLILNKCHFIQVNEKEGIHRLVAIRCKSMAKRRVFRGCL